MENNKFICESIECGVEGDERRKGCGMDNEKRLFVRRLCGKRLCGRGLCGKDCVGKKVV